eukprot:superscaffoldBa00000031_g595
MSGCKVLISDILDHDSTLFNLEDGFLIYCAHLPESAKKKTSPIKPERKAQGGSTEAPGRPSSSGYQADHNSQLGHREAD